MQSGARGMEGCKWAENAALAAKKRGFFQARASRLERLDLLRLSYAALCGPRKMLRPLEGSRAPSRQSKVGGARSTRLLSGLLSGSLAAAVMVLQRINTGYTF
jgi:hypothetical protein